MFITMSASQHFAVMSLQVYPLFYLVVGLAVLFLRVDNTSAWLLALVFGGWLAGGPVFDEIVAGFRPCEGRLPSFSHRHNLAESRKLLTSVVGLPARTISTLPGLYDFRLCAGAGVSGLE